MRTLAMTLAVLTVTPAYAGVASPATRIARAIAPMRVSGSEKHGRGLVTFGEGGRVISTTRQRPDGTQVTRERQTYYVDSELHGAQVKTVTAPNGVSTTTTHVFGVGSDTTSSQGKYKPLTPARAYGNAIWASPLVKPVAMMGFFGLPMLATNALRGEYPSAAELSQIVGTLAFAAGVAAIGPAVTGELRPTRQIKHVETFPPSRE